MAWTTPRTWVTSEVVTAALMNTHVRDNTQYLKDVLTGAQNQDVYLAYGATDASGQQLQLRKARTSLGSPSLVSSGDTLGAVSFVGHDGSTWRTGASISAIVDATAASNDMPGRLVFGTTADGAGTVSERWRITNAGYLQANLDGAAATPVISWVSDTDTGIYRFTSDALAFTAGGTTHGFISSAGVLAKGGSSISQGFSFLDDTNTGIYNNTTDAMDFQAGGNSTFQIYNSITVYGQTSAWARTVNGAIAAKLGSGVPLYVDRTTDDGTLVSLRQDSTEEGTISVSGTTVSYNGFMGAHYVQLKPEQAQPPRYAVVAADDSLIPSENPNGPARENEPYIRPAKAADTAVYGVWGGKIKDDAAGSSFGIDGQPVYQIASLGLYRCLACDDGGPIAVGDLLEAADTRWHARRQADDIVRSSTLGKALEALPSGKGSVACVLYAG